MPYLRCLICSVPIFNVNCGSPDCVQALHVLCSSEATQTSSHLRLGSADYLLVPVSHRAGASPGGFIHGPPVVAGTRTSPNREDDSSSSTPHLSHSGIYSSPSETSHEGALVRRQSNNRPSDLVGTEDIRPKIIPQTAYRPPGSRRFSYAGPIVFGGITIREALQNQLGGLADFEKPAFQSMGIEVGQKMSIRIQIAGHPFYRRQVNVLRAKGRLPTRGELAGSVARDINRFLEKERQAGNPVRFNGRELTSSNVVLLGVQQVSQGSLQPELGIVSTAP